MPRDIPITRIRNIGIMAHIDAGKTTCAERILYFTGRVRSPGEVHRGNTELDHLPQERQKGITITAAATTVAWTPTAGACEGVAHRIQLIDTPGHIDFTIEVERSLRVLDGAVFVLDAGSGVECQSETVWHQADRHGVPRIAFINKVDKPGADVAMCMRELSERLGARPVLVTLPGEGGAVLDVLRQRAFALGGEDDLRAVACDTSEADREALARARVELVEACSEVDDEVLDAWCNERIVTAAMLERALRKGTLGGSLLVVLCGSALKNRGIHQLLDAIVAYLPSPADVPPVVGTSDEGERAPRDDEPFAGLAFKTVSDRNAGFLTFVRVYSGTIAAGDSVQVWPKGTRERVGRIHLVHAAEREEIDAAHAGAIVAISGLRSVRTGDTLAAPRHPIVLERIAAPEPVIDVAIEPKSAEDRDRLGEALGRMLAEDPSLRVSTHVETGQTILSGMGQLHLEITVDRLRTEHRVTVNMGRPAVAYRETIAHEARAEYRHIKQNGGGSGQYAIVTLVVRPAARGSGITFVDETVGGVIPKELVPGVEKGVRGAAARGVFAGYPVVDVHIRMVDGAFHAKDSSVAAFEIAGSLAFQNAARAGGAVLLEPVVSLEVTAPEDHNGDVLGDLMSRRGTVKNVRSKRASVVVDARAPLGTMFDWVSRLRGLTGGRGSVIMRVDGYEPVPELVARTVVARS